MSSPPQSGLEGAIAPQLPPGPPPRPSVALLAGYVAMVAGSVLLFLLFRSIGSGLSAPPPFGAPLHPASQQPQSNPLVPVLLGLLVIILASQVVGRLFRAVRQPAVMGEVFAGILLGPSFLGHFAPHAMTALFAPAAVPHLGVISQVGVLLFLFLVGVRLREQSHITLAISHASIVCPFVLGSGLALLLYPRLSSRDVEFTPFALFLAVSLSVTAFPVLARILTDRGLERTRMGGLALTCAAVDDVTAWCLLALVVGVVRARPEGALLTALLTLGYIAAMFLLVRPVLLRRVIRHGSAGTGRQTLAVICVGLLASCLATEAIGIHALFGAFLFGAIVPHDSALGRSLVAHLEDFVVVMLLPAFFAYTGLRTQIGLLSAGQWLLCSLILFVAFVGKFGGSAVAARLAGLGWRDAAGLGILMNTRGLMELIVLNVGLDLGVISPRLFAMLVVMAVVSTFATAPILDRLVQRRWAEEG